MAFEARRLRRSTVARLPTADERRCFVAVIRSRQRPVCYSGYAGSKGAEMAEIKGEGKTSIEASPVTPEINAVLGIMEELKAHWPEGIRRQ